MPSSFRNINTHCCYNRKKYNSSITPENFKDACVIIRLKNKSKDFSVPGYFISSTGYILSVAQPFLQIVKQQSDKIQ